MKHTTRSLKQSKLAPKPLHMLTCYDYQTAVILNETELDLILVGDSLANVMLGLETTVEVGLNEMTIFGAAVKRGAKDKFVVVDLPFGTYSLFEQGVANAIELFQKTKTEALKLEGANELNCKIIKRLVETGIPVMGHIGLQPQSVHSQGGYYKHGKSEVEAQKLLNEAKALEAAGCFAIVLECVQAEIAATITRELLVPTIGIGSGSDVDGQVLVLNDLLGLGKTAPTFVKPIANLFNVKKELISQYLN